ncbi:hypothetical protein SO802_023141 [Lithocarpus litseifolius]|uniref:Uncharacterized protein n=1 Tax=Lithocarpus litseifolius TaxID=425828 RepID=A0AAW2C7E8_9ROSI
MLFLMTSNFPYNDDFALLMTRKFLYNNECLSFAEMASVSPTPSLEVVVVLASSAIFPPITRSIGEGKVGKSVWEDPATAVGRAHDVITDEELRDLSVVPFHKLVLGESFRLTTDYLSIEEKVVVAQSKLTFEEGLSGSYGPAVKSKEKADELKKAVKVEKKLVAQKDDELQAALLRTVEARDGGFKLLRRWMLKHQGEAIDLSTLDFEVVDTEMIADEAKKEEKRATEEVAFVLADIEAEVGIETTAIGAEITAAEGGEATDEGVDG